MPRKLIGGLIQCSNPINDESAPIAKIKKAMFDKHVPLIEAAGKKGDTAGLRWAPERWPGA